MPHIYRISAQQAKAKGQKAVVHSVVFGAVVYAAIVLFLFAPRLRHVDPLNSVAVLLLLAAVVGAVVVLPWIHVINLVIRKRIEGFQLEITENSIVRRYAGGSNVTIGFNEVTALEQYPGKGTRVKTAQSNRSIWLPSELQGYNEVVEALRQRSSATLQKKSSSSFWSYFIGIAYLAGFILLVGVRDRRLILTIGAVWSLVLLWNVVSVWRNRNFSRKLKRALLLLSLLQILGLIAWVYFAW